jgi:hypothetical protein
VNKGCLNLALTPPLVVACRLRPMTEKPRVLFVCTHNSARSQMAEGMLRNLAEGRFEVHSRTLPDGRDGRRGPGCRLSIEARANP